METPQSGSDGLTLGDAYPLQSFVGTIDRIRRAIDEEDGGTVENLRKTMKWQLSNLDTIKNPFATRVQEILVIHLCHPSRSMFVRDALFDVKQDLYGLIREITEKAHPRTNIIPFEHTKESEDAVPVEKAA